MTVLDWLLDSDPSIRWQVIRDLTDERPEAVAAERVKVAAVGWGARLLALQGPEGQWGRDVLPASSDDLGEGLPDVATRRLFRELHGVSLDELAGYLEVDSATISTWESGEPDPADDRVDKYRGVLTWMRNAIGTYNPAWTSTTFTLLLLRDMGLDPASDQARRAVALVRDNSRWDHVGQRFFDGEVEPCVNGMAVALGAYFDQNVDGIVDRLLGEQLDDGGWNCEAERGSIRSSFNTTIVVLEGLLEYEQAKPASSDVTAARIKAQEYFLERRMLRRLSTGEIADPVWTYFSFPTRWHYDVLRGLDFLRSAGVEPDERCAEAVDPRREQTRSRRAMAPGKHPSRPGPLRDGGGRRQAQPLEHPSCHARAGLVRGRLIGQFRLDGEVMAVVPLRRTLCRVSRLIYSQFHGHSM